MKNIEIENCTIIREPLFPLTKYKEIPNKPEELDDFVDRLFTNDPFREALFLASPALYYEWKKVIDGHPRGTINNSILKYFLRSVSNSVPFGMFGSYHPSNSSLPKEQEYSRFSTLDMEYLMKVVTLLNQNSTIRRLVKFRKNNTIYLLDQHYRYIETKMINDKLNYVLSSLDYNEVIEMLLNFSKPENTLAELADLILQNVEDVDLETAEQFVEDLIEANVFISSLEICLNDKDPFLQLIDFFEIHKHNSSIQQEESLLKIFDALKEVKKRIEAMDSSVFNSIEKYEEIFSILHTLEIPFDIKFVINSNLRRNKTVNAETIMDDQKAEEILNLIKQMSNSSIPIVNYNLDNFKNRFHARYEESEIPLLEVFDNELGIGYIVENNQHAVFSTLIDDVEVPGISQAYMERKIEPKIYNFWLNLLMKNGTSKEIDLTGEDLKAVYGEPNYSSFGTSIFSYSKYNETIYLRSTGGTSATNLIGRFSNNDTEIKKITSQIAQLESEIFENKIVAEIIHLTNNRIGNVLLRSMDREHELSIVSKPTALEKNIDLSDITLSVRNNLLILKSISKNKEIIPFLSSAQNYHYDSLPVYQFLCDLQNQYRHNFQGINLGGLNFESMDYVPTIKFGKDIVIFRAKWKLSKQTILQKNPGQKKVDATVFKNYLDEKKVPQFVFIFEGGEDKMIIDTHNSNTLQLLVDELNKSEIIILTECNCSFDQEDLHVNEYLCLFKSGGTSNAVELLPSKKEIQQHFSLGDEWLYLKLYTGLVTADEILTQNIGQITTKLLELELIDKWFFIRYNDPDFHLRFRVHLPHISKLNEVIDIIHQGLFEPIEKKKIWKVEYATYKRELDRYHTENILNSETLFFYDSQFSLALFDFAAENGEKENTWLFALKSINDLFDSFNMEVNEKHDIISTMFESFWKEFGSDKNIKKQIDKKFRMYSPVIDNLFRNDSIPFFIERKNNLSTIQFDIRSFENKKDLLWSYIHMNVNRIIQSNARFHELIMYGILQKQYKKEIGMLKHNPSTYEVC